MDVSRIIGKSFIGLKKMFSISWTATTSDLSFIGVFSLAEANVVKAKIVNNSKVCIKFLVYFFNMNINFSNNKFNKIILKWWVLI